MQKLATAIATLTMAACSKGDDCAKFWDKASPVMRRMTPKGTPAGAKDKFLKDCRASDKQKTDPTFKCVIAASNEAAVQDCMGKAFGDYMSKAKTAEAQLHLTRIGKNAKVVVDVNGSLPVGKAGPTPAEACCKGQGGKCAPSPDWATNPVWDALDLVIEDFTRFQYSYESADGKTATATAVGDTDCDGTTVTYTLQLTVGTTGVLETKLVEPTTPD
jgi:hypothetical protein